MPSALSVSEASRMIGDDLRRVLVALARERARRHVVAEVHARIADGDDRGLHRALVHLFQRHVRRPVRQRCLLHAAVGRQLVELGDREVAVRIDAERAHRSARRGAAALGAEQTWNSSGGSRGGYRGDELSSAHGIHPFLPAHLTAD
jgi:hypothetical protein